MVVLENVYIVDRTGQCSDVKQSIIIQGELIEAVVTNTEDIPKNASVINLDGKYVLPGFIDAHTHIGGTAGFDHPPHTGRIASYDYAESREQFLRWGVTTVRDAGAFIPDCLTVRDSIENGILRGPSIVSAGRMIQAMGGHPWNSVLFRDAEIEKNELFFVKPNDSESTLRSMIRQEAAEGVDWIKIVISDDNCMDYPNHLPRISEKKLGILVDEAHKQNLKVMAHCDGFDDAEIAVAVHVDSIEHTINNGAQTGWYLSENLLTRVVDAGIWWVPTIIATYRHDGSIAAAERVMPYVYKAMRQMIAAGVNIAVGTDSGIPFVPFGSSLHEELRLLVECGMKPSEAIAAATWNGARMLGKEGVIGLVKKGYRADLVVLNRNPTEDISDSQSVEMVLTRGRISWDAGLSDNM